MQFLPDLQKFLIKRDGDNISLRSPVMVALVRVLLQLPRETMDHHLPGLLTKLTGVLREKLQSVRDAARVALIEVRATLITGGC